MPWTSEIEAQYDSLLAGAAGQATDLNAWFRGMVVKPHLVELETGSATNLQVHPANWSYLTSAERLQLHGMRVACALFVERNELFPWRLVDHDVDQLRPLLSYHYQGLRETSPGRHKFHHVWDVKPGMRMTESVLGYVLAILFGVEVPRTERGMVANFVSWMRDSGWAHMTGIYDEFDGYPDHGGHVYDFDAFTEVKRSGCHGTADYVATGLRYYNIPAHYGGGWPGSQPSSASDYWAAVHQHGHCFIHFATEHWWMSHADDVYNALWKAVPPEFAMMSSQWMNHHHFGSTHYEWTRERAYQANLWWCFLIGESDSLFYDVPTLYFNGTLRSRLENIHISYDLASRDGAPASVPPVFDADMVDFLMNWVALKLD